MPTNALQHQTEILSQSLSKEGILIFLQSSNKALEQGILGQVDHIVYLSFFLLSLPWLYLLREANILINPTDTGLSHTWLSKATYTLGVGWEDVILCVNFKLRL